ncbi:diguanylate cyclase [Brevibacillus panacihumi]|uniref:diguanylate cyclase n=1 Tax=Brevibacillus panacihumi TaxID=497735 RepID=UPI001FE4818D|nr:diguanylate cyclase [Brevibacillus panacihumi]
MHDKDLFFRYGGDEFIILFFQKDWQQVSSIWESIQQAFAEKNSSSGKPYTLSVSRGLYQCEKDTDLSIEEIMKRADCEMYKDKQGQRLSSSLSGKMV